MPGTSAIASAVSCMNVLAISILPCSDTACCVDRLALHAAPSVIGPQGRPPRGRARRVPRVDLQACLRAMSGRAVERVVARDLAGDRAEGGGRLRAEVEDLDHLRCVAGLELHDQGLELIVRGYRVAGRIGHVHGALLAGYPAAVRRGGLHDVEAAAIQVDAHELAGLVDDLEAGAREIDRARVGEAVDEGERTLPVLPETDE